MRIARSVLLLAAAATVVAFIKHEVLGLREPTPASVPTPPLAEPVVRLVDGEGAPVAGVRLLDPYGRSWRSTGQDGLVCVPRSLHGVEVIAIDDASEREVGRYVLDLIAPRLPTLEVRR